MPTYRYEVLERNGGAGVPRMVDAPDRAAAVRLLAERGEVPTRLETVGASAPNEPAVAGAPESVQATIGGLRLRKAMSRQETTAFIRELATAVNAGLPLVQALRTIARQGRTPVQRAMLNQLIEGIERGQTLSDSMRDYGPPFNDMIVNLVHAGEVAGRLGEVMSQAAKLLERDVKLRRSVGSALIYPAIIAIFAILAITVVVTVIVPRVLKSVSGSALTLPWPTRVVQGLASFVSGYWWLIVGGIAAGVYIWSRLYRQPGPRLTIDTAMLRAPVFGPLLRDVAVARFTRTFGTLVGAGLPVLTSLRIVKNTLGNRALETAMDEVCERVAGGRTIAEPLEATGFFPPLLVQIVSMGERTGRLDELLAQAADAFEEKTEQSVKIFTAILPPLLVVVLAMVVGFIVLAVLLPLIELQGAIS